MYEKFNTPFSLLLFKSGCEFSDFVTGDLKLLSRYWMCTKCVICVFDRDPIYSSRCFCQQTPLTHGWWPKCGTIWLMLASTNPLRIWVKSQFNPHQYLSCKVDVVVFDWSLCCFSFSGYTHLIMEGVCVAFHRNLSQSHPLFKLLAPHFLYLIAINTWVPVPRSCWISDTCLFHRKVCTIDWDFIMK